MREFVRRYELDTSVPGRTQARQDFLRRTLLPVLPLWAFIVLIGFLFIRPMGADPTEGELNEALVASRTPAMDAITSFWSNIGATFFIISFCSLLMVVLWYRTRQWWLAIIPGMAVSLQALVFVTTATLIGRGRPEVEHLDISPPTSGFPSGHTGATTAFYLTVALLAQRLQNPVLRWGATILCLAMPFLVGYARLYRGMHHLSDVIVGLINGVVCAWLAWRYLRRDTTGAARTD